MKVKLLIILGLLLIIGLSCGEPYGGGVGYQYLGHADSIQIDCDVNGRYITIVRVDRDAFTVTGKVEFRYQNCIYVWINVSKKSLRLRRQRITREHIIIHRMSLDWRTKNVGK